MKWFVPGSKIANCIDRVIDDDTTYHLRSLVVDVHCDHVVDEFLLLQVLWEIEHRP